jgi:hypothetical protein
MTTKDIIAVLTFKGFTYTAISDWQDRKGVTHFLYKGDCFFRIYRTQVEVRFPQTKSELHLEGNLIGPFRDGVMFDLDSREMVR